MWPNKAERFWKVIANFPLEEYKYLYVKSIIKTFSL